MAGWMRAKRPWAGCRGRGNLTSARKNFVSAKMAKAQEINVDDWRREALLHEDLFLRLYAELPKELIFEREQLMSRL